MLVRIQAGGVFKSPKTESADSVMIMTDEGMPVVVAQDLSGRVMVATGNDPNFKAMLQGMGYDAADIPEYERLDLPVT